MEAVQAETAAEGVLRKGSFTCTGKKSEEPKKKKRTMRGKNNVLYSFKQKSLGTKEKKKKEKTSPQIREIRREKNNTDMCFSIKKS